MMKRIIGLAIVVSAAIVGGCTSRTAVADGEYTIELFTTNDVHGRYFDSLYVGNATKESLLAVNEYMNEVRSSLGRDSYLFIDAGDCLQGDNAAYYYNYVDTKGKHLYARIAEYMDYDAICVGNHDIETGHAVYDKIAAEMSVPFLASNALHEGSKRPYFKDYVILDKQGFKVAVIGFTNPGIKGWLAPEIWSGIQFESLIPFVQDKVDKVIAREHPDIVIAATHSGTGKGDGSSIESQGLDLLSSLKGVDFLICAHDHRPFIAKEGELCLINSGSHCRNIGHGALRISVKDGKIVSKTTEGNLIPVDKTKTDEVMREAFRQDYEAVKAFSTQPVGKLEMPLITRESFKGMCDYMNLLHTICLECEPAQLSIAAPLTMNGYIKSGEIVYNDLFTIYPFENQLFVVKMTGQQIKDFLEYTYDMGINTYTGDENVPVLKIKRRNDPRTGTQGWSFEGMTFNFDTMAGAFYTVDVTKPMGERIEISTLADGTPFELSQTYNVAMTSYRASGGGGTMTEGAGIDVNKLEEITVARYPEIRELVYQFFKRHVDAEGNIMPVTSEELSQTEVMGEWHFVPTELATPRIERDWLKVFAR